ncbi:MAG TPA: hypothetical protein VHZ32_14635 [Rhizomicrobium sp.]|nr:hypothetical protein [Rhizomicrobium sp.]
MTSKLSWRLGASFGAVLAMLGTVPAMADTTTDFGRATVTLGGFLAEESVYRSRSESADIGSSYSGVPFSNAQTAHVSENRFTARQSRLSLLVQGDVDSDTHIAMWNEFDFLGAANTANSNESNSYNLRIRNMYATIDWDSLGLQLLAGQNWSLVTLNSHGITPRNEVSPATIDAQYVVGFNWTRQPQIRITKNWNKEFWLAVSVENPQTTFAGNAAAASGITVNNVKAGGSQLNSTTNYSLNHIPDFVGKIAWEPVIDGAQPLHMEVLGIYRSFYDRVNVAAVNGLGLAAASYNNNTNGGGVGGSITWQAIPKTLDLQATAMTGSGIGRYGSGSLPDTTFRPDGSLAPAQETTFLGGVTLHATPLLDFYVYGGQEAEKRKTFVTGAVTTGLGSPTLNLSGCLVEGGACSPNIETENQVAAGLWWRAYQGKFGSFRMGLQYSYTHLSSFSGVGGIRPTTDDSMVFTSIRYYPF